MQDVSRIPTTWADAKGIIYPQLRSMERHKQELEDMPHRVLFDMAVCYYLRMDIKDKEMEIFQIPYELMEMWKCTEEELFETAVHNMIDEGDVSFANIQKFISEEEDIEVGRDIPDMYVLSNKCKINGAGSILYKEFMRLLGDLFDGNYLILPTSIHELIIVPVRDVDVDIQEFYQTLADGNDSRTLDHEVLSYTVYKYDRRKNEIVIA